MPKILIICDVYPPSFAPRMGYLVKYMKELGWTADIVARGHDGDFSFKSLLGEEKLKRVNEIAIPMKSFFDKISRLLTQKRIHRNNAKLFSDTIIDDFSDQDYSMILCSTSHRTYLLEAARQVAKAWNKPWIADIRDIYEQKSIINASKEIKDVLIDKLNNNYFRFMLLQRNKSLQKANSVVTISPWHVDQLKKYNNNVQLIYNGFCPEQFFPKPNKVQHIFKVSYTGMVFSEDYQDPTLLFLAVKKLAQDKIIDKTYFRIQFFTPKNRRGPILENPAYHDISDYVDFFDYVDTSDVPQVLAESSIVLLLTNVFKEDGPKGIMTTKYFEYLAMERPILCVRSDENLLENSIKQANAGIAARTVEETYEFLLRKWNEWKETGNTTVAVNRDYTRQFSRKLQAKQFVNLFEEIKKN